MGILITLLVLIGIIVLWVFFNFPPQYAKKEQLSVFNWTCTGVCFMICGAYALNVDMVFSLPAITKYRMLFMVGGALVIEIVFFIILFLLRNFWVFKPPTLGRGYFK